MGYIKEMVRVEMTIPSKQDFCVIISLTPQWVRIPAKADHVYKLSSPKNILKQSI